MERAPEEIIEATEESAYAVAENNSGSCRNEFVPEGVKGWSWGAFCLNWIWAIGNRTWIGLLCILPIIGFFASIYLGFKGRELAWKNKKWESVEEFDRIQKLWSKWGVALLIASLFFGFFSAFITP